VEERKRKSEGGKDAEIVDVVKEKKAKLEETAEATEEKKEANGATEVVA